jgi:hypothetical protein
LFFGSLAMKVPFICVKKIKYIFLFFIFYFCGHKLMGFASIAGLK